MTSCSAPEAVRGLAAPPRDAGPFRALRLVRAQWSVLRLRTPHPQLQAAVAPGTFRIYQPLAGQVRLRLAGRDAHGFDASRMAILPRGNPHALEGLDGPAELLCGTFEAEPGLARVWASILPAVLAADRTPALEALQGAARALLGAGGGEERGALERLAEALLVEGLQAHVQPLAGGVPDGDRLVGHCLALMHRRLDERWTLRRMAGALHTSRTVLAERFAHAVGEAPIRHLTRLRLAAAARQLLHGPACVGRVAESVGYQSEHAFIRAFRREYGAPPATWRRDRLRGLGTPVPAAVSWTGLVPAPSSLPDERTSP